MKPVIFDFDGVIADSFQALVRLNVDAMADIGAPFSPDDYRNLFDGNVHGGFRSLIPDDDRYGRFCAFKKKNRRAYYGLVEIFPGMTELLTGLAGRTPLAIVSSTEAIFIEEILGRYGIAGLFHRIIGDEAHSKEDGLRVLSEAFGGPGIMVSDTVGDIVLARSLGFQTIAVAWGFHSANRLTSAHPDRIVATSAELARHLT